MRLLAVVYFQIVGTHNTANEVFHAVHFESPAQPTDSKFSREFIRLRASPPAELEQPAEEDEHSNISEEDIQ